MLTWSDAPVVSYYGPLLSSSKAGDSIQPQNRQLTKSSTSLLPHGYLGVAPPLNPTPFLLRITISANNYRGIPPRPGEAVIIAVGHAGDRYAQLKQLNQQQY